MAHSCQEPRAATKPWRKRAMVALSRAAWVARTRPAARAKREDRRGPAERRPTATAVVASTATTARASPQERMGGKGRPARGAAEARPTPRPQATARAPAHSLGP